jgi:SAM-dependent methyltransferase
MSEQGKALVEERFGANAHAYVQSGGHRSGPDLERVLDLAGTPSGLALDIATGGGHTALGLARHGWQVVASDLTRSMLRAARGFLLAEGFATQAVAGDAERTPFRDAAFSLITCRTAAHHFPDVPAFAAECRRVLAPAGRLVVQDLVGHERPDLDAFLHEVETRRDPSHVRSLRLLEWHEILRSAGFKIEATHFHRSPHDWEDWTGRMGMTAAAANELWQDMLAAPAEIRDYYEVGEVGGRRRFVNDSAIMSATVL